MSLGNHPDLLRCTHCYRTITRREWRPHVPVLSIDGPCSQGRSRDRHLSSTTAARERLSRKPVTEGYRLAASMTRHAAEQMLRGDLPMMTGPDVLPAMMARVLRSALFEAEPAPPALRRDDRRRRPA